MCPTLVIAQFLLGIDMHNILANAGIPLSPRTYFWWSDFFNMKALPYFWGGGRFPQRKKNSLLIQIRPPEILAGRGIGLLYVGYSNSLLLLVNEQ